MRRGGALEDAKRSRVVNESQLARLRELSFWLLRWFDVSLFVLDVGLGRSSSASSDVCRSYGRTAAAIGLCRLRGLQTAERHVLGCGG